MIIDIFVSSYNKFFYSEEGFSEQLIKDLKEDANSEYYGTKSLKDLLEKYENQKEHHTKEWLYFKFMENCTIPSYIFDKCKRLDIIYPKCIMPKNDTYLAKQMTELIHNMELEFIVSRREFNSSTKVTIVLEAAHPDFGYDLIDYLFKNSM